ncbi:MAG: hypothetical protein HQK57_08300 [Deltaproteobacteria bacterium]|nr:hypothetical protein [Deltaproteobacteria bacterium]MBF0508910.1 hypothetical protein [Deltaproteobacteria bacterium]
MVTPKSIINEVKEMSQGVLPFRYEGERSDTGMTSLAGLPVYLDLAHVLGMSEAIDKHLQVRD